MPAQFDALGIQFLYPDNWVVAERPDDESESGVTLEMPSGGFFSIEKDNSILPDDELIERVISAIRSE